MGALRFSACIEMLFTDRPYPERIAAVAEAGLPAVEFWGWRQKDMDGLKAAADEAKVQIVGFVAESASALVNPQSTAEWVKDGEDAVAEAARLGVPSLIVTTGQEMPDLSRQAQHEAIVAGLKALAPAAESQGVTLCLEPLNILVDHKGYYLSTSDEGFQILEEVSSPRVKLLFDIYHQQITEGNLIARITEHVGQIGHFHVADVPGRHQPGTGEINYANIFGRIADLPYDGYVGLEFRSSVSDPEALATVRAMVGV